MSLVIQENFEVESGAALVYEFGPQHSYEFIEKSSFVAVLVRKPFIRAKPRILLYKCSDLMD